MINFIKNILKNKRFIEIIKFVINGFVSFIVDYGLLYLFTDIFKIHYLISTTLSFTASVIVNYIICVIWVFKTDKKHTIKTKIAFVLTSVIGALINLFIMWIFVDIISIYYLLAKIISTIIVMIWNYFTKRLAIVGREGEE